MELLQSVKKIDIKTQWDSIAEERYYQIQNGEDDSFTNVLLPNMVSLMSDYKYKHILDVGCGNGILTQKLTSFSSYITGIDLSEKNIEIAKLHNLNSNISFYVDDAEKYHSATKFDCIISNMVLMDAMNVDIILKNLSKLLNQSGVFIFSITHPCYWPIYWNYYKEDWFDYNKELIIENNFRVGEKRTSYKTVHFHRPLEFYIKVLKDNNFTIEEMKELKGKNFSLPRFLLVKARRGSLSE